MDAHEFGAGAIRVRVKAQGAELCSLRFADGREMLWQAGPAWPRHAPVLFPIVGRLVDDTLRHGGSTFRMTQHGFARDHTFRFVDRAGDGCTLELTDDAETRAMYPFSFRFLVGYAADGATLRVTFRIENTGGIVLPASVGGHPAFRWPLRDGVRKDAHRLVFPIEETGPVRRLEDGLLLPDPVASPVANGVLPLDDAVFAHDAIILESPASRSVKYEAPGTASPAITVAWEGFATLGIWSKPADFVCIEPWSGIASPKGAKGEFQDKPGIVAIPCGEALTRVMSITLHDAA